MTHFPAKLIDQLIEHVPGFEREEEKYAIAAMLWDTLNENHKHKKYRKASSFTRGYLRRRFGTDERFRQINRYPAFRYFIVRQARFGASSKRENCTNGYYPRTSLMEALYACNRSSESSSLMDETGRIVRSARSAISSLDSGRQPAVGWKGVYVPSLVHVDLEGIQRLEQFCVMAYAAFCEGKLPAVLPPFKDEDGLKDSIKQVMAIRQAASTLEFPGCAIHRYIQSASGRLHARGANLQNYRRFIRQVALNGHFDYDIEACHFAAQYQLAAEYGHQSTAVRHYVEHKNDVRRAIADDVGLSIDQAKEVLTMTAYGATESLWRKNAIPEAITVPAARRLYAHPLYRAIRDDLETGNRVILAHAERKGGHYLNKFRKELLEDDAMDSTIMSFLLQGIEATALRAAIRTCPDAVVLLVHDGFVTTRKIDVDALHQAVREATGFNLKFSHEQIKSPFASPEWQEWEADLKTMNLSEVSIYAASRRVYSLPAVTVEEVLPPVWPEPLDGFLGENMI